MTSLLKVFISSCFILLLSACSNDGDIDTETTAKTVTKLPPSIKNISTLTLIVVGGELNASITIDGGSPIPMTIDLVNGTSSVSIPGLEKKLLNIMITYSYTGANNTDTVILATATRSIDLNTSSTLSFAANDYEIDAHDDDNDGVSNLAEINSETDPTDDTSKPTNACILDDTSALIGSCILG